MKILLFNFFILISIQSLALTNKEVSNMVVSMADFSEKEKLTEKDIPELTRQIKNILILEKHDESHEGPFELTTSYPQNKVLYQRVIQTFSKKDQKILQHILGIVENMAKNGNG